MTRAKKKYASGPSGSHTSPRFLVNGTPAELDLWEAAAQAEGTTRAAFMRAAANEKAAKLARKNKST